MKIIDFVVVHMILNRFLSALIFSLRNGISVSADNYPSLTIEEMRSDGLNVFDSFQKGRELTVFVSDKFENYKNAFNKIFYHVAKLRFGVPIKASVAGFKHNNNPIERYNGKIKDRTKIIREGFGSFDGGETFTNLNHIIHNFVNPHQELKGKTPAQAAEINLPLENNKLLELIEYVAKKHHITKN